MSYTYAKDSTYKNFKSCFNSHDKSYAFNVLNPFYFDKLYITDIKQIKNKIMKTTYETYSMNDKGLKSYSDSYDRVVYYAYYCFDEQGLISDEYNINVDENGYVFSKKHIRYRYTDNEYIIEIEDLKKNKTDVYKANIIVNNDELVLSFDKEYKLATEYHFSKNKITKKKYSSKNREYITEYILNDNQLSEKYYSIYNGSEELYRQNLYNKCCLINQRRFNPNGDEIYNYEENNRNTGIISYTKVGNDSKILQEYKRIFNSIGFIEYEEIRPYKTNVGNYSYTKQELLDERDDFFYKHFE